MAEELGCEELKNEMDLIIQQLCDSSLKHALSVEDLYLILSIEKPHLEAAIKCLVQQGIVCEQTSNTRAFKRYEICNRKETCGNTVDLQRIADILEGNTR